MAQTVLLYNFKHNINIGKGLLNVFPKPVARKRRVTERRSQGLIAGRKCVFRYKRRYHPQDMFKRFPIKPMKLPEFLRIFSIYFFHEIVKRPVNMSSQNPPFRPYLTISCP
jgi:hypothetical protein